MKAVAGRADDQTSPRAFAARYNHRDKVSS
jgi:hypothetical protein